VALPVGDNPYNTEGCHPTSWILSLVLVYEGAYEASGSVS
jgi:hypothetical protein